MTVIVIDETQGLFCPCGSTNTELLSFGMPRSGISVPCHFASEFSDFEHGMYGLLKQESETLLRGCRL